MTNNNNNNFTIKDNSSDFAKYLPNKWIEPLTIIARVKNYSGIDEYILELIQDRIEMFADTRDNLDNAFQEYMHNMIKGKNVPNEWRRNDFGEFITTTPTQTEKEESEKEDFLK